MVSYAIVTSIVLVMVWQAITHLNQGRRKTQSLLGSFKMDDIEVEDVLPPSRMGAPQSLVAPRIEYSADMTPFPSSKGADIRDSREVMKQEISELTEVNIERYSVLERSTEKVAE